MGPFFFFPAQKLSETRSVGTTDIYFFWSHFLDFPFCLDKTHPKKKLKFWSLQLELGVLYFPRESKDQTLPIGSRESYIYIYIHKWTILKTILCLVLDFQGLHETKNRAGPVVIFGLGESVGIASRHWNIATKSGWGRFFCWLASSSSQVRKWWL